MRNRTATTLALGTATALGLLASAAQAESVTPAAQPPAAKGPMLLTADQMDSVTAGQTTITFTVNTSGSSNASASFASSVSASTSLTTDVSFEASVDD